VTYASQDTSVQSGSPVLLFLFVQGVLEWRYCSAAIPVEHLGETWVPTPLSMGGVSQSSDMVKDTLSLKFPRDHEFAGQFLGYSPDQVTTLTVFRGHLNDVDGQFITYWKGRIASFKAGGETISIECEPIFTSLRRPGLRARWQRSCRYALYQRGCGLDPEDFGSDGTCTTVDGVNIVVPEAAALAAGWLVGGMVKTPDGVLRYIVAHSGANIKLIRPVDSLSRAVNGGSGYGYGYGEFYGGSVPVRLYPGCDHSMSTCKAKFNNLPNYGGFPWIPNKNPMGGSSIL
jgi:uncharacterized phage protein (TIGR02218 family)